MNSELSSSAGDFVQDLGSAVRENPVSAALIGMGLVWLFTGAGNPVTKAQNLARRTGMDRLPDLAADAFTSSRETFSSGLDAVAGRASTLAARANDGLEKLTTLGSDFADKATPSFSGLPDRTSEIFSTARGNLSDLFERQPLFLGAVGIAIGAGIAASLPSTDFEADLLGEASDEFKQTASQFVSEQKAAVSGIASGVATAVTEEAKAQGLTRDAVHNAATDTLQKLQNVAAAASDSVKDRLSSTVSNAAGKSA